MGGIFCSFSTAPYPEAISSTAAGADGGFFLHFCGAWLGELVCALWLSAFLLTPWPRNPGSSPHQPQAPALTEGPGCPRSCSEPLVPHRLQRAVSRSGALGFLAPNSTIGRVRSCCRIARYPWVVQLVQGLQNRHSKGCCLGSLAVRATGIIYGLGHLHQ